MLEATRIRKVPPSETTLCAHCGARWEGIDPITGEPVREFVAFDSGAGGGSDEVPLIDTMSDQEGVRLYQTRTVHGDSQTVTVGKQQVCSDCLKAGAAEVGYGDTLALRAELEEVQSRLADVQERLVESERQREEAETVARSATVRAAVAERANEQQHEKARVSKPKAKAKG